MPTQVRSQAPTFHSDLKEDQWIWDNIPLPASGAYVDAGCGDPVNGSQTAFLRELGWRGVAIDANDRYRILWSQPEMIVAVLSDQPMRRFWIDNNPSMSRMRPIGQLVRYRKLGDVLAEHQIVKIDFLSIDIEGHEFNVMKDFDYERHAPTIIVAEYATLGMDYSTVEEDFRLRDFLTNERGYKAVHKTKLNVVYEKES